MYVIFLNLKVAISGVDSATREDRNLVFCMLDRDSGTECLLIGQECDWLSNLLAIS